MILYPAIDLKDGQCVRLLRGEMDAATVFSDNPAAQAEAFVASGAEWLHLVDLNGAFAGAPVNGDVVRGIRAAVDVPIQLGGGIRTLETIDYWLNDIGISRVILGTVALRDPELVKSACKAYPNQIAVGIDARDGKVAVEGWAEVSEVTAPELALRFEDAGVAAIIFTDIQRDGAMQGVNVEETAALAARIHTPVIASGGVSSLDDIRALKSHESDGVSGAILGRSLYDGAINLKEALALC